MQRAGALKNIENTPTVYIVQFQSASSTQGNKVLASCYLSLTDTYSKYKSNGRSGVIREEHPEKQQPPISVPSHSKIVGAVT